MSDLRDTVFATPEAVALFSGAALAQRMLDVEAALARAQARAGLIPPAAAEAIAAACRADRLDPAALYREAAQAGTPVIPLVRMLTALIPGDAQRYVHRGATSQDILDTALMLLARDGLDLITDHLMAAGEACAGLADRHRRAVMPGRTLLQHAVPITFGLKAARWLAQATRLIRELRAVRAGAVAIQLGGAAGTLAALGPHGLRVMELLAAELDLPAPDLPWHTERDRIGRIAMALALMAGAMGKVATDLLLLAQTEVAEVASGSGRSSAMPHKRNPVEATNAAACARAALGLAPTLLLSSVQEHERAAGAWQAEWHTLPELFRLAAAAVAWIRRALEGLAVDPDRMRVNLDLTGGLLMAESLAALLAERLGRPEAFQLVDRLATHARQDGIRLADAAVADPAVRAVLSPEEIARACDPSAYLGSAEALIDRALGGFRALRAQTPAIPP